MVKVGVWGREGLRGHALVDDADAEMVGGHRWNLLSTDKPYVFSTCGGRRIFMHRLILGLSTGDGLEADHVNGDKLDNRRSNLRVATRAQNQQNRGPRRGSHTSKYRGVHWAKAKGKWQAQVMLGGKLHYIGRYDDEDEAGAAASAFREAHMPFTNEDRAVRPC